MLTISKSITHVVAHISIHDEDEISRDELQAINISSTKAELPLALQKLELVRTALPAVEDLHKCFCNIACAIGAVILDDDDLVIKAPARIKVERRVNPVKSRTAQALRAHWQKWQHS